MIKLIPILLCFFSLPALAAIDAYPFDNDVQRDRYNALIDELRCPQCLNTNLAGSDSMIAKDLRREVHRLVLEGKSDEEILDYMYQRYGDFILYEPRVTGATLMLWFGPFVLLLLALFIGFKVARQRQQAGSSLSDEEQQAFNKLVRGETD